MTNKGAIKIDDICICAKTVEKSIVENEKDDFHIEASDLIKDGKLLVKIFN